MSIWAFLSDYYVRKPDIVIFESTLAVRKCRCESGCDGKSIDTVDFCSLKIFQSKDCAFFEVYMSYILWSSEKTCFETESWTGKFLVGVDEDWEGGLG